MKFRTRSHLTRSLIARSRILIGELRKGRRLPFNPHQWLPPITGGSEQRDDDSEHAAVHITVAVLSKLVAGTLPTASASQVWVGESTGNMCDICEELIRPREVEHQVSVESLGVFRSHRQCFAVWDRERAWYLARKNLAPPASPPREGRPPI